VYDLLREDGVARSSLKHEVGWFVLAMEGGDAHERKRDVGGSAEDASMWTCSSLWMLEGMDRMTEYVPDSSKVCIGRLNQITSPLVSNLLSVEVTNSNLGSRLGT